MRNPIKINTRPVEVKLLSVCNIGTYIDKHVTLRKKDKRYNIINIFQSKRSLEILTFVSKLCLPDSIRLAKLWGICFTDFEVFDN